MFELEWPPFHLFLPCWANISLGNKFISISLSKSFVGNIIFNNWLSQLQTELLLAVYLYLCYHVSFLEELVFHVATFPSEDQWKVSSWVSLPAEPWYFCYGTKFYSGWRILEIMMIRSSPWMYAINESRLVQCGWPLGFAVDWIPRLFLVKWLMLLRCIPWGICTLHGTEPLQIQYWLSVPSRGRAFRSWWGHHMLRGIFHQVT